MAASTTQLDSASATRKSPSTRRGQATQRKLLDAAAAEFGAKGFHDTSIVSITTRAGVALGSFYTYFESKDELFRALVNDMSDGVRLAVAPAIADDGPDLDREGHALAAFLAFAREHKELYRIIDEAEFVAPNSWRDHYATIADRIQARLAQAHEAGEARKTGEVEAWALMGMNVFLGLRYGVQDDDADLEEVAGRIRIFLERGLAS